ncbi:MAG: cell division protein ZipA C-terminal FtsZ-binding domain-containing protein [Gammaproteobacteria bacterium]|nr:cell division protein ZipA C-terminal FtsZ-binding domain-containing protein [Gammaproteobacteria bacterium]
MNDLRLILLVLGLAIILGLYVWEVRKERSRQRRATILHETTDRGVPSIRFPGDTEDPGEPGQHGEVIGPALERTAAGAHPVPERLSARREAGTDAGRAIADLFHGAAAGGKAAPVPHAPAPEDIIALHVAAPSGTSFKGPDIVSAAAAAGFRHGAMKIFHHYGAQAGPAPQPLFSMADMFEPGCFETEQMPGFATRGLTLFMNRSASGDDALALELMLKTAEFLADSLGGELCGPDHGRLDARGVSRLRERVRAGARKGHDQDA